jgi:hypothetical protein
VATSTAGRNVSSTSRRLRSPPNPLSLLLVSLNALLLLHDCAATQVYSHSAITLLRVTLPTLFAVLEK